MLIFIFLNAWWRNELILGTYMLSQIFITTVFSVFSPKKSIVMTSRHGYHDFTLFFVDLSSILRFLTPRPSVPNRETMKSSAVGAVTGLRLDLSREWIWICWEWIDIWTGSFQFQAWLHLELLSCRGQWETPQSAQFGVAAIVFYGVSICELALPFQSLKIFLNYGCSQYVSDLDSKEEHGRLRNCPLTEATGLSWFFPSTEFDWLHGHCSKQ